MIAGFCVAMVIARRVKRLARSAEEMAAAPRLEARRLGRDEIGDLARALDSMRASLKESFGVLTADRDKLNAIFDGLTDAVMVVDDDGTVRFSNGAAAGLVSSSGHAPEAMVPRLRRAADVGFAAHPALRIGDRTYSMQARDLPEEDAVLVVVRDRTDEMRREFAERDFVSNAAHELRNPLAGISGAIEVLQTGAKDDLEARDQLPRAPLPRRRAEHNLTQSLLTLARVGRSGRGGRGRRRRGRRRRRRRRRRGAARHRAEHEIEPDLAAKGDPTCALIGLLTNAFKNTPTPGTVTVSGRRDGETEVVLEVSDTGTRNPGSRDREGLRALLQALRVAPAGGLRPRPGDRAPYGERHGWTNGTTSIEGEGSTFWVRLPVAQPSPTPVA